MKDGPSALIPGSQKSPGSEKTPPRRQPEISVRKCFDLLELRPAKNTVTPPVNPPDTCPPLWTWLTSTHASQARSLWRDQRSHQHPFRARRAVEILEDGSSPNVDAGADDRSVRLLYGALLVVDGKLEWSLDLG